VTTGHAQIVSGETIEGIDHGAFVVQPAGFTDGSALPRSGFQAIECAGGGDTIELGNWPGTFFMWARLAAMSASIRGTGE
jgi:hypothetical protein